MTEQEKELQSLIKELGITNIRVSLAPDKESYSKEEVVNDMLNLYVGIKNKDKSIVTVFSTDEDWKDKQNNHWDDLKDSKLDNKLTKW